MSHAQLDGGRPGGTSGAGSGWVSLSTNVEVESGTVGFTLHKRLLVPFGSSKHGSLILFPTAQRHASARNGAAMEFVQQDPLSTGVELAGIVGTYAITCVTSVAGLVSDEVDVASFAVVVIVEGLAKKLPHAEKHHEHKHHDYNDFVCFVHNDGMDRL